MSFVGSWLATSLPDWAMAVVRYSRQHRTVPNLIKPRTFNEKVLHRIVFGRESWMTTMADKYRVRDYVAELVGPEILPKLYYVTTDPDTIPFDELPKRFVIKPTHGSGWVEVVRDKDAVDRSLLLQTCRSWLNQSYYDMTREWAYKDITPRIMVEELVDDGSNAAPHDYKLFVFDGRVEFILVTMGRFATRSHIFLDRHWNPVDVAFAYSRTRTNISPPPHLAQMIDAAEKLAQGTGFVRADFYDTNEKLFFGELTATPGCALDRFEPASFDAELGAYWKLEPAELMLAPWKRRQPGASTTSVA